MSAHHCWVRLVCDVCGDGWDCVERDVQKAVVREDARAVGWHCTGYADTCPVCWEKGHRRNGAVILVTTAGPCSPLNI